MGSLNYEPSEKRVEFDEIIVRSHKNSENFSQKSRTYSLDSRTEKFMIHESLSEIFR